MPKLFYVDILAPDKKVYEGEVASLIAPAELGYLGILANHAPIITTLAPGKIMFRDPSGNQTTIYSKGKGFLEVFKNNAILLLDSVQEQDIPNRKKS